MAPVSNVCIKYFDIKGKAEYVRLAFAIGGVDFTDERVPFAEWKETKPNMRWHYLPELTLTNAEGEQVTVGQSNAILRFAGKLTGLYPSDVRRARASAP